ncbi:hypothetical protein [Plantibacter cousiniae (nom. nud.)]|uniref:hypothetical protein n=1 Tax=Plantibacter cousiniae (nom. nud.) TaxID=199709 RepID=UPI001D82DB61|nr:hypothetical protein [Plantibacter cousiniae]CAH0226056.1 hypothetical protein SRABI02_02570 [Plantibacter cousiniae]
MFDIEIPAPDGASSLAAIGRALGAAGIGLEGGGLWSGVAHYLVAEGARAGEVLRGIGFGPVLVREVLVVDLVVDAPGALGRMMERLAGAGVVLHGQYSDHDNRKVLLVDDVAAARRALETAGS